MIVVKAAVFNGLFVGFISCVLYFFMESVYIFVLFCICHISVMSIEIP